MSAFPSTTGADATRAASAAHAPAPQLHAHAPAELERGPPALLYPEGALEGALFEGGEDLAGLGYPADHEEVFPVACANAETPAPSCTLRLEGGRLVPAFNSPEDLARLEEWKRAREEALEAIRAQHAGSAERSFLDKHELFDNFDAEPPGFEPDFGLGLGLDSGAGSGRGGGGAGGVSLVGALALRQLLGPGALPLLLTAAALAAPFARVALAAAKAFTGSLELLHMHHVLDALEHSGLAAHASSSSPHDLLSLGGLLSAGKQAGAAGAHGAGAAAAEAAHGAKQALGAGAAPGGPGGLLESLGSGALDHGHGHGHGGGAGASDAREAVEALGELEEEEGEEEEGGTESRELSALLEEALADTPGPPRAEALRRLACAGATREEALAALVAALRADFGRQYLVTGQLTPELYDRRCRFADVSGRREGPAAFSAAAAAGLPPFVSMACMDLSHLQVDALEYDEYGGSAVVTAKWRLAMRLRTPFGAPARPLAESRGRTRYRVALARATARGGAVEAFVPRVVAHRSEPQGLRPLRPRPAAVPRPEAARALRTLRQRLARAGVAPGASDPPL
eukprot:tig00020610_g11959.t1